MMALIYWIWGLTQTWHGDTVSTPLSPSAPASLHPNSRLHPHFRSKWMTPAGVGRLMLGPARWHWQLNYPTGRSSWLSVEKSSGCPSFPSLPPPPISQPPLVLFPVPLSPLVKRGTPSPSSPPGSSWQVISTITITTITGVINKWPTPSQGNNKGFIIHHARPYKYMSTGNK